ncbi:hypothetical protein BC943DRAFT_326067 [Umbelopsis sp. AD052]|nr:hypothetical protein BC943DRAFT_326067 [Umbelopsis sp. AD052]
MKSFFLACWAACLLGLVVAGGPLLGGLLGGESTGSHVPATSSTPLSTAAPATGSLTGSTGSSIPSSVASPHPSNRPIKPGDELPSRLPDVIVTSYVVDTPTNAPNTSQKAESTDVSADDGPQHLITAAIVISCVVAVTMIAIFIFRRIKLKPSHSFKQKLSSRPASFVSPIQHHDAVFLRELQHV